MSDSIDPRARTGKSSSFLQGEAIHAEWESDFLNPDLDRLYEAAFARIVDALEAPHGATILDAGCGYCYHAARFARMGLDVVGVDLSEVALANARENLQAQGLSDRVTLRQGDLLALPFADGSFRYASCWGVLMHVPELERALSELARVVEPGGRLSIMENNASSLHAVVWDRLIRGAKKVLGRPTHTVSRTHRGIEEWRDNGLLVRRTHIPFLVETMRSHGMTLVDRFPSQFTEMYTNVPTRPLKRMLYGFNQLWFDRVPDSGLALGNVLVFEKRSEPKS